MIAPKVSRLGYQPKLYLAPPMPFVALDWFERKRYVGATDHSHDKVLGKTALFLCAVLLVVQSVAAQPYDYVTSGDFRFDPIEPPALVTWSVATADNRSVSLQVRVTGNNGGFSYWQPALDGAPELSNRIDERNAPYCNMDFEAWKEALADPDYNRSIMQFGSQVKEQPLPRSGIPSEFELTHLLIFTGAYFWPNWPSGTTSVFFNAHDVRIIPEPATAALVMVSMASFVRVRNGSKRGYGRAVGARCQSRH
jgi:hypothetical protein